MDGAHKSYDITGIVCMDEQRGSVLTSYPNPSSEVFVVDLFTDEMEGDGILQVIDSKGALVHERIVSIVEGVNNYYMSLGALAPGLYYISVKSGDQVLTVKHSLR